MGYLPEHLILQRCSEFVLSIKIYKTSISQAKRHILTEFWILPLCLWFQQNSSFSLLKLPYPEHLKLPGKNIAQNTFFTDQLLVAAFKHCNRTVEIDSYVVKMIESWRPVARFIFIFLFYAVSLYKLTKQPL